MYQKILIRISSKNGFIYDEDNEVVTHAIKNGIPLPAGHGVLIDADSLIGKIHGVRSISAVLDAPTIIEADKEGKDADSN